MKDNSLNNGFFILVVSIFVVVFLLVIYLLLNSLDNNKKIVYCSQESSFLETSFYIDVTGKFSDDLINELELNVINGVSSYKDTFEDITEYYKFLKDMNDSACDDLDKYDSCDSHIEGDSIVINAKKKFDNSLYNDDLFVPYELDKFKDKMVDEGLICNIK